MLTTSELAHLDELICRRNALLERRTSGIAWNALEPRRLVVEQAAVRDRERAEGQILAYLLREKDEGPVDVGDIRLHLTVDRLNFLELDRRTGMPVYSDSMMRKYGHGWSTLLYRYPRTGCTNAPAIVP